MLPLTRIKETCLYVTDLERTRAFYQDKLGLPLIHLKEGRHAFFRAGDSVLLCFLNEATRNETELPRHFGEGELHLAFEVQAADYEAAKQHLAAQQIAIEHEQEWPQGRRSFYFRDPDQHALEIVMPHIWGD